MKPRKYTVIAKYEFEVNAKSAKEALGLLDVMMDATVECNSGQHSLQGGEDDVFTGKYPKRLSGRAILVKGERIEIANDESSNN